MLFKILKVLTAVIRTFREKRRIKKNSSLPEFSEKQNLVVSLTSYPARINNVWIVIESIFQQDIPVSRVVLVLSETEFKGVELPDSLKDLMQVGLEVLWIRETMRSYQKLLPVLRKYPESTIVTVDDDIIYEPWRLSSLVDISNQSPKTIVAHRGRKMLREDLDRIASYRKWPAAPEGFCDSSVLLTGVGGVLYPPGVLDVDLILDYELASSLCPLADDLWFWYVSIVSRASRYCLGNYRNTRISPVIESQSLSSKNCVLGENDRQIMRLFEEFDLWNEVFEENKS